MPAYLVVQVIMSLSWQLKQLDEQGKYVHVSYGGVLNLNGTAQIRNLTHFIISWAKEMFSISSAQS